MDLARVCLRGFERDGETKTAPAAIGAALLEGTKQIVDRARRKTAAFILDLEEHAVGGCAHSKRDAALLAGELERVVEQIGDRRSDDLAIPFDRHAAIDGRRFEANVPLLRVHRSADLELGDLEGSLALWEKLAEDRPQNTGFQLNRARLLFQLCRADEAVDALEPLFEENRKENWGVLLTEIAAARNDPREGGRVGRDRPCREPEEQAASAGPGGSGRAPAGSRARRAFRAGLSRVSLLRAKEMRSPIRLVSWTAAVTLSIAVGSVACNSRRPSRVEGSGEQRTMLIGPRAPLSAAEADTSRASRWTSFREFWFTASSADIRTADLKKVSEIAARSKEDPLLQFAIDRSFDRDASGPRDAALCDSRVDAIRAALIVAGVPSHRIRTGPFGDARLRSDERVDVLIGEGEHYRPADSAR